MIKHRARTKIVCTIGPASNSETVLRRMMLAGMDVVRLNFSHGTLDDHANTANIVRRLNKKYGRRLKLLGDLEGFRIRIGNISDKPGIPLKKNERLFLSNKTSSQKGRVIPFDYEGALSDIKKGHTIFVDDGNIALLVESSNARALGTKVIVPGILKTHKGINIPDAVLRFDGLTEKDKANIVFAIEQGVDFIAQSFVRSKRDMSDIRKFIQQKKRSCPQLIAKIENREAIDKLDEIIGESDGIMVARGDLGVSLPIYEVPVFQKIMIKKARQRSCLTITATQMLESMTDNLRPTRAEVSDVANAILDGTDYVMLSAETSVGKNPVAAVQMMNDIIKFTESRRKLL